MEMMVGGPQGGKAKDRGEVLGRGEKDMWRVLMEKRKVLSDAKDGEVSEVRRWIIGEMKMILSCCTSREWRECDVCVGIVGQSYKDNRGS